MEDIVIDIGKINDESIVTDLGKLTKQLQRKYKDSKEHAEKSISATDIHFYGFLEKCLQELFDRDNILSKTKIKDIGKSLFYLIPNKEEIIEWAANSAPKSNSKLSIKLHFPEERLEKFFYLPWELLTLDASSTNNLNADITLSITKDYNIKVSRIKDDNDYNYNEVKRLNILIVDTISTSQKKHEELESIFISGLPDTYDLKFFNNFSENQDEQATSENFTAHIEFNDPNIIHYIGDISAKGEIKLSGRDISITEILDHGRTPRLFLFQQPSPTKKGFYNEGYKKLVYQMVKDGAPAAGFIPYFGAENNEIDLNIGNLIKLYKNIIEHKPLTEAFSELQKTYYGSNNPHLPFIYFCGRDLTFFVEKPKNTGPRNGPKDERTHSQEPPKINPNVIKDASKEFLDFNISGRDNPLPTKETLFSKRKEKIGKKKILQEHRDFLSSCIADDNLGALFNELEEILNNDTHNNDARGTYILLKNRYSRFQQDKQNGIEPNTNEINKLNKDIYDYTSNLEARNLKEEKLLFSSSEDVNNRDSHEDN